ncbi:hypothetical protein PINS_up014611 [Pythium insidiosum]|nr:hypothetical protein PINS_up014611 [Pythium insidiosum]
MTAVDVDAEGQAMLSLQRFRRGVARVLAADERLLQHPAVQHARQQTTDWLTTADKKTPRSDRRADGTVAAAISDGSQDDDARAYLQALAACLVHEDFLWIILKHLRAFAVDLMARLMDPAIELYEQTTDASGNAVFTRCSDNLLRRERVAEALVTLLAVLPHTKHTVLQYLADSPCFFEYVSVAGATQSAHAGGGATACAAYRADREATPLWNWSSFYPLCFHDDVRVRWLATRAVAIALRMTNTQRNAFLTQLGVHEDSAVDGRHDDVRKIEFTEFCESQKRDQRVVDVLLSTSESESASF